MWWSTIPGKAGGHHALRDRHADRGRNPLPQRASRRLDARSAPIFGMARGSRADLPELLEVFDGEPFGAADAGQIEKRIEQHAAVAGGQDKPVPIGPMGIGGVEFERVAPQHRRDVGRSHWQTGVAALGLLDRVEGEKANRIGHRVVRHARRHRRSPQETGRGLSVVPSWGSGLAGRNGASVRGGRRNLSIASARALTFRSSIA